MIKTIFEREFIIKRNGFVTDVVKGNDSVDINSPYSPKQTVVDVVIDYDHLDKPGNRTMTMSFSKNGKISHSLVSFTADYIYKRLEEEEEEHKLVLHVYDDLNLVYFKGLNEWALHHKGAKLHSVASDEFSKEMAKFLEIMEFLEGEDLDWDDLT